MIFKCRKFLMLLMLIMLIFYLNITLLAQEQTTTATTSTTEEEEETPTEEKPAAPKIDEKKIQELLSETKKIRYDPKGRRDPFLPLVWKSQENPEKPRPKGFEGMTIAELQLIGTWIGHEVGGNKAFFLGSDKKSYMRKVGDRCYNGKIVAIEENKVVFEMEIFDPFGNPKPPKVIIKYVHKPKEGEINE